MTAKLIDGAAIAETVYAEARERVAALAARGIQPGLAAVLVGDDPASQVYVRNKERACASVGMRSEIHRLAGDSTQGEVLALVRRLNAAPGVHGILVQLPLPRHLEPSAILQAVAVGKDVDGFNWSNLGALASGVPQLAPCTPSGVMRMLDHEKIALEGCNAVVIGRSVIVGKPMALLLLARGATVTVCHSRTRNLSEHTMGADVVVAAVGRAGLVAGDMLKPGAVVIDVGINRLPNGKLAGDVDFASASSVASRITPVPGGVGRMTVAMLILNTVAAAERY